MQYTHFRGSPLGKGNRAEDKHFPLSFHLRHICRRRICSRHFSDYILVISAHHPSIQTQRSWRDGEVRGCIDGWMEPEGAGLIEEASSKGPFCILFPPLSKLYSNRDSGVVFLLQALASLMLLRKCVLCVASYIHRQPVSPPSPDNTEGVVGHRPQGPHCRHWPHPSSRGQFQGSLEFLFSPQLLLTGWGKSFRLDKHISMQFLNVCLLLNTVESHSL